MIIVRQLLKVSQNILINLLNFSCFTLGIIFILIYLYLHFEELYQTVHLLRCMWPFCQFKDMHTHTDRLNTKRFVCKNIVMQLTRCTGRSRSGGRASTNVGTCTRPAILTRRSAYRCRYIIIVIINFHLLINI